MGASDIDDDAVLIEPLGEERGAKTTKVAPCNSCAGPNTAPRNEWAIMIWSETSTAYKEHLHSPSSGIADQRATRIRIDREQCRQALRRIREFDRRRDQCIEGGIVEQFERRRQSLMIRPARPVDAATLPTWLEINRRRRLWKAWPSGTATSPLPYQLSSTTAASSPARRSAVASPAALALAWNTTSQFSGASSAVAKPAPNARARSPRPGTTSTTVTRVPGMRAHNRATMRPTTPPPTTAMRSAGPGAPSQTALSAVSHVGREHRALWWDVLRHHQGRLLRHHELALVRMQHEYMAATQRPVRDRADDRIAVLDGVRKRPGHERGAHALELAFRHASFEHQPFGAAADGAEARAHQQFPGGRRGDRLVTQLGSLFRDVPQSFRRHTHAQNVMPATSTGDRSFLPFTGHSGSGHQKIEL